MKDDSDSPLATIYEVTFWEGPISVSVVVVITVPLGDARSQKSRNSAILSAADTISDLLGTTYVDLLAYKRVSLVQVSTFEDIPYVEEDSRD